MGWQSERLEFHRCHPKYQRSTVLIAPAYRLHIQTLAKKLNLLHLGDGLFFIKKGRDSESVIQAVEAAMDAFDEAVENGAA